MVQLDPLTDVKSTNSIHFLGQVWLGPTSDISKVDRNYMILLATNHQFNVIILESHQSALLFSLIRQRALSTFRLG